MAGDLRTLVMTLKISTDVERVGDHAVNIAQCAKRLAEALPVPEVSDLDRMAEVATGMLRDAIAAFIDRDAENVGELPMPATQAQRQRLHALQATGMSPASAILAKPPDRPHHTVRPPRHGRASPRRTSIRPRSCPSTSTKAMRLP